MEAAKGDPRLYKTIVNHEEQYSILLADEPVRRDWQETGFVGTKEECETWVRAKSSR